MYQRYQFEGHYARSKGVYSSEGGLSFIYSEREPTKPTKPKSYLLYKEPNKAKRYYFSGLYPKGENIYKADHRGVEYTVSITSDCLTIKREDNG